jgi:hypothetical protein
MGDDVLPWPAWGDRSLVAHRPSHHRVEVTSSLALR